MAKLFPIAFPVIVKDAIVAVVINVMTNSLMSVSFIRIVVMITPADPEITPQISPITSQQKEDTLSAFF